MPTMPVLRRFDIYVYKPKGGGDPALVPAASATVGFFRQGATVSVATSVGGGAENVPVTVYNSGAIQAEDELRVNFDRPLMVNSVSGATIYVTNETETPVVLAVGDRLIDTFERPKLYKDPLGTVVIGISTSTDGSGRASGYVREYRFDYVVSVSGEADRIFPDAEGSFVMR